MQSDSTMTRILSLAESHRLTVKDRGNGHIQIAGPHLMVNYYPDSKKRSAYVAGTVGRVSNVTPERAVQMALEPPPRESLRMVRRNNYRAAKRTLFAKSELCHWCQKKLTMRIGAANQATLDHRIPLFRGGLDNANNWVLACEPCNHHRGHDMPETRQEQPHD